MTENTGPAELPTANGSLLDEVGGEDAIAPIAEPRKAGRVAGLISAAGRVLRMSPIEMLHHGWSAIVGHPRVASGVFVVIAGAAGAIAWLTVRIEPPPDYETANLDVLFNYTLLTDDFNRLPVEERIALIGKLIERLKSMGGNDSLLLALFASSIMGEMRAQLEENISRLAVDVADKYAEDYDPNVPSGERVAYLEDAFINMQRMFAVVDQDLATRSREEMLEDGRRQARRDLNRFQGGKVGAGEVIRVFDIMNNKVGAHMSGHERVRVQTMFRDMTEMLRAEP